MGTATGFGGFGGVHGDGRLGNQGRNRPETSKATKPTSRGDSPWGTMARDSRDPQRMTWWDAWGQRWRWYPREKGKLVLVSRIITVESRKGGKAEVSFPNSPRERGRQRKRGEGAKGREGGGREGRRKGKGKAGEMVARLQGKGGGIVGNGARL